MHLGFDRLTYPGDSVMQSLWNSTPLAFVAAYLAPAPSQGYTGWMPAVPTLRAMGWGIAPVYVGQQAGGGPGSHTLTAAQGATDALDASMLAQSAGLDAGSVVYLDVELGGTLAPEQMAYIVAWVTAMNGGSYRPGVYCSFSQSAAQIVASVGDIPVWAFHPVVAGPATIDLAAEGAPDPAGSGFGSALVWQHKMSLNGPVTLQWVDRDTGAASSLVTVDLDTAVCLDPSNPVFPSPVVTLVDPSSGAEGDTVTVTGSDFSGATDVGFGFVSAANVSFDSDVQISAVVPGGLSGLTVDVIVSNRWGLQSNPGMTFSGT
jgi:hypothetical protein